MVIGRSVLLPASTPGSEVSQLVSAQAGRMSHQLARHNWAPWRGPGGRIRHFGRRLRGERL